VPTEESKTDSSADATGGPAEPAETDRANADRADGSAEGSPEPIRASGVEKGAAVFILVLMGASLVYLVWTVIRFWGEVGV